ncbi:hypothetical protein DPMN_129740 [Dreissena polymorpha]|uniref:Major facilitator superfamily (MFS) profile domain-containing protein n=1 Tax=Dreissena polymorpha TaxID=45954 RepID=A0A9D4K0T9_DREPO|nr:hypothetical protein DPMN_129740 [Dreissena polymorpha]
MYPALSNYRYVVSRLSNYRYVVSRLSNYRYVVSRPFKLPICISGVGLGSVYIPAISAISFYFNERLPLASGIAASGVGVGNFLYPPVIRWLVITFDWKSSFLVLGGLTLNICVLGALIRPVKRMDIPEKQPVLDFTSV